MSNVSLIDGHDDSDIAERCVCCGRIVPEGNLVCPICETNLEDWKPKKPIIHGYREGREINTISYTCPICNKHIGRENICKHCGQLLDWSDTNDRT